jgi:ribosome assembly protein 4
VRVWNVRVGSCLFSLCGHTDSVEALRWGGVGFLYSASRDRTIKVWGMDDAGEGKEAGKLVRTLSGHGHRINSLALSCEYVCRTGPFDHKGASFKVSTYLLFM